MAIKQQLEKILTKFGETASPTFVAMSIACAKGICRPAFTMMDTKESYETKRYTALREGLTELIAIPVYYLSGVISKFAAKKLAVPKNFMSKKMYKRYSAGDSSKEVLTAVEHAKNLAKTNLSKIETTAPFVGVGLSALLFIPLICSITIKPIMKTLETKNNKTTKKEIVNIAPPQNKGTNNKPYSENFKSLYSSNIHGMIVGGL